MKLLTLGLVLCLSFSTLAATTLSSFQSDENRCSFAVEKDGKGLLNIYLFRWGTADEIIEHRWKGVLTENILPLSTVSSILEQEINVGRETARATYDGRVFELKRKHYNCLRTESMRIVTDRHMRYVNKISITYRKQKFCGGMLETLKTTTCRRY